MADLKIEQTHLTPEQANKARAYLFLSRLVQYQSRYLSRQDQALLFAQFTEYFAKLNDFRTFTEERLSNVATNEKINITLFNELITNVCGQLQVKRDETPFRLFAEQANENASNNNYIPPEGFSQCRANLSFIFKINETALTKVHAAIDKKDYRHYNASGNAIDTPTALYVLANNNDHKIYLATTPKFNNQKEVDGFIFGLTYPGSNSESARQNVATVATIGEQGINLSDIQKFHKDEIANVPAASNLYETIPGNSKEQFVLAIRDEKTHFPGRIKFMHIKLQQMTAALKINALVQSGLLQNICITVADLTDTKQVTEAAKIAFQISLVHDFVYQGPPANQEDFNKRVADIINNSLLSQYLSNETAIREIMQNAVATYDYLLTQVQAEKSQLNSKSAPDLTSLNVVKTASKIFQKQQSNSILSKLRSGSISKKTETVYEDINWDSQVLSYVREKYGHADNRKIGPKKGTSEEALDHQRFNEPALVKVELYEQWLDFTEENADMTASDVVASAIILKACGDQAEMHEKRKSGTARHGGKAIRSQQKDMEKLKEAVSTLPEGKQPVAEQVNQFVKAWKPEAVEVKSSSQETKEKPQEETEDKLQTSFQSLQNTNYGAFSQYYARRGVGYMPQKQTTRDGTIEVPQILTSPSIHGQGNKQTLSPEEQQRQQKLAVEAMAAMQKQQRQQSANPASTEDDASQNTYEN